MDPRHTRGKVRMFAASSGGGQVLQENTKRNYLLIQNTSPNNVLLSFGVAPSAGNSLLLEPNGGSYVAENMFVPTNAVYVGPSAGGAVIVVEG